LSGGNTPSSPSAGEQQAAEGGGADGQTAQPSTQAVPEDSMPTVFPKEEILTALQQSPEGWSYGNALISLLVMAQAAYVIGRFFYRRTPGQRNIGGKDFLLRIAALGIGLATVVVTSITSDFSKPALFVDKASLPIIILLVVQQLIMVGLVRLRPQDAAGGKKSGRFRVEKRFDD
jgi:hypothetical protein